MDTQPIHQMGHSTVHHRNASSILTKSSGYIGAYDYTLNPYSGCAFGCTYCYAAFFARSTQQQTDWGYWVEVKANALDLLKKKRRRPITDKAIYMSSVTDPYQPVEKHVQLTRAILQELVDYHQPTLVIQTRGSMIVRDIDLLLKMERLRVNMTVTTDDENVRKAFEPTCPSNEQRLQAITQLHEAGIDACITMTPLLPLRDVASFADTLVATGIQKFVVQEFHAGQSRFAAGTGEQAKQLATKMGWNAAAYRTSVALLRARLPEVREGKNGFAPTWLSAPPSTLE